MVLAIALGILIFLLVFFITVYNMLVFSRNRVKQSFSNIDVLLKQRNDEIGNLVNVVRGYADFEKSTLKSVIRIRNSYSPGMGVYGNDVYNHRMNAGLKELFAVVENYPELKANEQFMRLQKRITQMENHISDRREYYNWSVTNYNTRREQFPYSIIASLFNFEKELLFKYS